MVRPGSLFSQLIHEVPRSSFDKCVAKHDGEKHAKGFTCWNQFVAMEFCHLERADSLREICNGLSSCNGKLQHLGIHRDPRRSTLSYANNHRPAELYEDYFWECVKHFRGKAGGIGHRKTKFRFKNKLLSLDSSVITLCTTLFPWADYRRKKGGIKLHVLLDHDDYMPRFVSITQGRLHDVKPAQHLDLPPGSIVAMDRGYNDYDLFGRWTERGVFFVTRLKSNAQYEVIEEWEVPEGRNVISDETIRLVGQTAEKKCPYDLRRIVVWDPVNKKEIVLLTNHLSFGASTISAIYKDRWEIELFFKCLKQNLKIKTFVGTSENAVRIQIWTALIALLLLKWLHFMSRAGWSFSNLASLLRMNLFTYRHLRDWLDDPFGTPPEIPGEEQLNLGLKGLGQNDTRR